MLNLRCRRGVAGAAAVAALVFSSPLVRAQSPADLLHRAYYLQHEKGDFEAALKIYREIADNRSAPAEVRKEAETEARGAAEDLASLDLARLVPPDAIAYLELSRPGERLEQLFGALGLLRTPDGEGSGRVAISPRLLRGMLGLRGAAVALTEIDPRQGPRNGVIIMHPGDLDLVRGLIESALPVQGEPVEAVGGFPTYSIEGHVLVTLTERLVVASPDRAQITAVVERLRGADRPSLASSGVLAATTQHGKRDDLAFFCINLESLMPMLDAVIEREAKRQPEMRAALAMLDLHSLRCITGRAGVDGDGVSLSAAIELDEDHHNVFFHLLRVPGLDKSALAGIPAGVAFFGAESWNPAGPMPKGLTDARGEAVPTLMGLGRELFANLTDVAVFALPSVMRAPFGPMPEMALVFGVNDAAPTRALLRLLLGSAQVATGGAAVAAPSRDGEVTIDRFEIHGVPVLVASTDRQVVVSPSEAAVRASIEARRSGRSVHDDKAFAQALAGAADGAAAVMAVNAGRCADLAFPFLSERERREAQPFAELLRGTSLWLGMQHTANRFALDARISGVPNIGPMVSQLIEREMRGGRRSAPRPRQVSAASASTPVVAAPIESAAIAGDDPKAMRAEFERLHADGEIEAARAVAVKLHAAGGGDANYLNTFAWALVSEPQFGNHYNDLALAISKTSNEISDWSNWYFLDTYATALGRVGDYEQAIAIERKAIEVGKGDPRIDEARQTLKKLIEAADKARASKAVSGARVKSPS